MNLSKLTKQQKLARLKQQVKDSHARLRGKHQPKDYKSLKLGLWRFSQISVVFQVGYTDDPY